MKICSAHCGRTCMHRNPHKHVEECNDPCPDYPEARCIEVIMKQACPKAAECKATICNHREVHEEDGSCSSSCHGAGPCKTVGNYDAWPVIKDTDGTIMLCTPSYDNICHAAKGKGYNGFTCLGFIFDVAELASVPASMSDFPVTNEGKIAYRAIMRKLT